MSANLSRWVSGIFYYHTTQLSDMNMQHNYGHYCDGHAIKQQDGYICCGENAARKGELN